MSLFRALEPVSAIERGPGVDQQRRTFLVRPSWIGFQSTTPGQRTNAFPVGFHHVDVSRLPASHKRDPGTIGRPHRQDLGLVTPAYGGQGAKGGRALEMPSTIALGVLPPRGYGPLKARVNWLPLGFSSTDRLAPTLEHEPRTYREIPDRFVRRHLGACGSVLFADRVRGRSPVRQWQGSGYL